MPPNLENSAVATGLEKVSFHSNPKERQCQRMFKLLLLLSRFSRVRLCATPQTAAHQALPSLGFSRQESTGVGCHCLLQMFKLHAKKVMFKLLQARLQQYVNYEFPHVQAGFRKGRRTRHQTANINWIIEKAREFQKKSTSALLTLPKPWTIWITTNCGKLLKKWEYRPPYLPSEISVCRSRSNS